MLENIGFSSLLSIVSHLLFIGLAWWALQSLQFEKFLRKNRVAQARLLYILLAIAIGSTVSNFFLDYFIWSNQITYIFQ
ncbi:DUF1146 family protein [Fervidibacillus halotolerans]|uniref:DUF1146 family protein n=1 Tax=Fervidibacillus halotolerans TaxID=2980027 RepID=A0A9E8LYQ0_9BACI|nr:DUF1146 family protein [Fervidibacillus halotolerans]WAA12162.1 DUF1146 family protein [Fervidibacillus halotolerans]